MAQITVGVDAGTSVVKAVAFGADGAEQALARRALEVRRPGPGRSEQDLEEVWRAVTETVREVASDAGGEVGLLAVTAQGDGAWFVDDDGRPAGPGILWNDARGGALVEEWLRDGTIERAFRINGSVSFAGGQSAILRTVGDEDPGLLERARVVFYCKDWLRLRLTGRLATDESDASLPFMDIRAREYSPEVLAIYGLEGIRERLPEIEHGFEPAPLTAEAAEALGLPEGLPVVVAPFDIASTAIGVGAVEVGQATTILGTTLCSEIVVDHVETDGEPAGMHVCSGVPDRWLRVFPAMSGTDGLDWFQELAGIDDPAEISEQAASVDPGADGLMLLPYLSPAGERAPFLDPHARGTLHGLSVEHGSAHLARAWLEGMTFVIRHCVEASPVPPRELRVSGGGAASAEWCQIIADVLGVPVITSRDEEVGAKGAVLTGRAATGEGALRDVASELFRAGRTYEPRDRVRARYGELFGAWSALRERVRGVARERATA